MYLTHSNVMQTSALTVIKTYSTLSCFELLRYVYALQTLIVYVLLCVLVSALSIFFSGVWIPGIVPLCNKCDCIVLARVNSGIKCYIFHLL